MALLDVVCPGQVTTASEIGCRTGCPKFTDFGKYDDASDWQVVSITTGHFLSPASEDAALSMQGCEPHSANFGGTILLTRRSGQWAMLWYKAGVDTSKCHKLPLADGRDILVCIGRTGSQGIVETDLYVEDLLVPAGALMAADESTQSVFSVTDTTLTCGVNDADERNPLPVTRSSIDTVAFSTSGARRAFLIVVEASYGRKNMTPVETSACLKGEKSVLPKTTPHRLEFVFDGRATKASPSSAKALRLFKDR